MPTQGLLEKKIPSNSQVSRKATGTLVAGKAVTLDTSDDAQGFSVKAVSALADFIAGVTTDSASANDEVGMVVPPAIVPMICVDANIGPGTVVYNDATGKCTVTNGANSTKLGVTFGSTNAANQLVSVRLTF